MKTIHPTNHTEKRTVFIIMIFFFSLFTTSYATNPDENTYPTTGRLFHIARSANKNLVCYDINSPEGILDTQNPLNVYWVNREETPGKTNGLNMIQRKMAYGYKVLSQDDDSCDISLRAYPDRKLTISKRGDKYVCTTTINGQIAILQSLYVKAKASNPLSVEYVELHGIMPDTQQMVSERIMNK